MRLLLLVCAMAQVLPAQQQPQVVVRSAGPAPTMVPPPATVDAPPVKPEERCTVEGNVYNSATGEPLRKANLVLHRNEPSPSGNMGTSYSATTDAGGHFTIAEIDPGKYRLSVDKTGFVNQQYGARGTNQGIGTVLALEKSQKMRDVNFRLIQHGVIAGRVLDEDGDPVQNVMIQVLRSAYFRGRKQMVPGGGGNTNDLGEYRVSGLAPGRYVISATYMAQRMTMEPTQNATEEAYAPTYYPGAQTPETGSMIEITPGVQLKGIDLRLAKTRAVRIRGRVLAYAEGKTVRNVNVMLMPKGDSFVNMMTMRNMSRPYNDKGDFFINNIPPGSYVVTAFQSEDGKSLSARVPLEIGSSAVENLVLQLAPGTDVGGQVTIEDGAGDFKNIRLMLQPKNMGGMMFGPGAQGGNVKDDRTFTFTNVQPELYELRAMGLPDGGYLKSVKVGDAEAIENGIDFSNGVVGGEIAVVVSMSAGKIDGSVQNDKLEAAKGALVVLVPEGKRRESDRYYAVSSTDQNGRFNLKSLAPGDYRAFAFDNAEAGAYQDPEWLKPHESKGEKISIKEGGTQSIQLKLIVIE